MEDYTFGMPSGPGFELHQYTRTYGKYDQLSGQSCTSYSMTGCIAGLAMQQVGPEGLLILMLTLMQKRMGIPA